MQIEVALIPTSTASPESLRELVLTLVRAASTSPLTEGQSIAVDGTLRGHVRHIRLFEVEVATHTPPSIHVHALFDEEVAEEDAGDGDSVAFQLYTLPSLEFDGLWESLVYEEEVQPRLLRYV